MTEKQNTTFGNVIGGVQRVLNNIEALPVITNKFTIVGMLNSHLANINQVCYDSGGAHNPAILVPLLIGVVTDIMAILSNVEFVTESEDPTTPPALTGTLVN